jgi:RNA polymerase sigma-70 factor (ECF subfamily)
VLSVSPESAEQSDGELVSRCRAGDGDAIRLLVDTYQGPVYGLCYRLVHHRHDAEDLTQEVLHRVFRSLHSWDGERPLRTWILAIAVNRCRTHLGRAARRPRPAEFVEDIPDEREPPPDGDLARELASAIAQLRPEYRTVITLFHEQELPYESISDAMGRPVGTIKTWLHRARAELAQILAATRNADRCGSATQ